MLFTSYLFIGFLLILFAAYYLLPKKWQAPLLLAANAVFYACAGWQGCIFIVFTILSVWGGGLLLQKSHDSRKAYLAGSELSADQKKAYKAKEKKHRKLLLTAVLLLNLGVLAAAKYLAFLFEGLNGVFSLSLSLPSGWILPMGISFYTLQAIGYLVDVYRESVKAEKSLWRFALFISFFPQLVQGPISRYGDLAETLFTPHPFDRKNVRRGLERILFGYFKKMVVADRLAVAVIAVSSSPETYRGGYALLLLFLYTVQLYADFTGGIDVVIGIGEVLGIRVKENFDRPFLAVSLKDYWRRWHITMCSWFRDYVFYPVSTAKWMRAFTKKTRKLFGDKAGRRIPLYLSSFLVWGATGVWHGANLNFIVWGLCNWAVLMISEELEPLYEKFHNRFPKTRGGAWRVFSIARTFLLVAVMNLFDCFSTLKDTFRSFFSIFTPSAWAGFGSKGVLSLGLDVKDYIVAGIGAVLMFAVSFSGRKIPFRDRFEKIPFAARCALVYALFVLVIVFGYYGIGYDAGQFIYNRF